MKLIQKQYPIKGNKEIDIKALEKMARKIAKRNKPLPRSKFNRQLFKLLGKFNEYTFQESGGDLNLNSFYNWLNERYEK
jgi:hypothetical protein